MKTKTTKTTTNQKYVLLRTTGAGVWCGMLVSRDGDAVDLRDAYRIWRWRGYGARKALTLSEVSQTGIGSATETNYTRVACAVPTATILGVHEILVCTPAAHASIANAGWAP